MLAHDNLALAETLHIGNAPPHAPAPMAASLSAVFAPVSVNRPVHVYGQNVRIMLGEAHALGTPAAVAHPTPDQLVHLNENEGYGVRAFQMRQSQAFLDAKAHRPRQGEAWNFNGRCCAAPRGPQTAASSSTSGAAVHATAVSSSKAELTGTVSLGVVIAQGPTADLKFTEAEITKIVAEVQEGTDWLARQRTNSHVTFSHNVITVGITTPRAHAGEDVEDHWRDPVMKALGYGTSPEAVTAYVEGLRKSNGTDSAYCVFFSKYDASWGAYAWPDRRYIVMTPDYAGWGPDNIDRVFAHESCHIFGCPDEYKQSQCNVGGEYGPWKTPNANCECGAPGGGVKCLMRGNDWVMCPWTPSHLGWPAFYLASVKAGAGTFDIDAIPDPQALGAVTRHQTVMHSDWSSGWTTLEPFTKNSDVYLFEYKSNGGTVCIDRINSSLGGVTEIWRGDWSSGWTNIKPFYKNGEIYLFECKESGGTVCIDKLNGDLKGVTEQWRGDWSSGWTVVEPFVKGGSIYLFEYKSSGGTVCIDKINDNLKGVTEIWRGDWSNGWTTIKPFYKNGDVYLFEYKSNGGTVCIDKLNNDLKGVTEQWRGDWSSGWSAVEPVKLGDDIYLFEYKSGDGSVCFDKINGNLQGVTEQWREKWSSGWSEIRPFLLP